MKFRHQIVSVAEPFSVASQSRPPLMECGFHRGTTRDRSDQHK